MRRWLDWWRSRRAGPPIPEPLWQGTWQARPFLAQHAPDLQSQERLRALASGFLARKEFTGAGGLAITDAMALDIAVQAVLPLLHLAPPDRPRDALAWYDDFVAVVVHPDMVLARRAVTDEQGVVHEYEEELAGEAMEQGPVMLSWRDVAGDTSHPTDGAGPVNVVIHEFAHKLDMRDGRVDACPPLPAGFLGQVSTAGARRAWFERLTPAFEAHREQVIRAERFGQATPWLDAYGAQSPEEFFPVACEAYFTDRQRFQVEFVDLAQAFDAFFRPGSVNPDGNRLN